jgi:NADH:ubiquinone oxidoreductase subunit 3 (subunit A)
MIPWVLLPPVAFGLMLLVVLILSSLMKKTSYRGPQGPGADKAYSCGEDMAENSYRPEYAQFFPFAFFFTIMHVAVLVLATVPEARAAGGNWLSVAALYVVVALVGVSVVVRKEP